MRDSNKSISNSSKDLSRSNYVAVPGINSSDFQLSSDGLTQEQYEQALAQLKQYLEGQKEHFLGYQVNQDLDYKSHFQDYLDYHINNVGDPFINGNLTVNSKFLERAVLDYYASLWHAQAPHNPQDPESYWGYVVSMGCTEGNLYALWNGRDYLSGKLLLEEPSNETEIKETSLTGKEQKIQHRLIYKQASLLVEKPHAYSPVIFYSEDTHYSIIKACIVLGLQTFYEIGTQHYPLENPLNPGQPWPKEVPSVEGNAGPGSIDIKALVKLVEFFASKGYPILVCFNYGTTFKGAYDDVEAAGNALMPIFEKYGLKERKVYYDSQDSSKFDLRTGFWFHVDGALGAAYMPFLEMAYEKGLMSKRGPNFDFRLPFVHSLAMSGHKWIGNPCPCGIYMTKTKYQLRPPDNPEYLGSPDTTFAGSRNGLSAMLWWDYLARNSAAKQIEKVLLIEELADYTYSSLKQLEKFLSEDLWVERTELSLTIRFKQVNQELIQKYSLSSEHLYVNGERRAYNHIFIMGHVSRELINQFLEDLAQPGAFPGQILTTGNYQKKGHNLGIKHLVHFPDTGRSFR